MSEQSEHLDPIDPLESLEIQREFQEDHAMSDALKAASAEEEPFLPGPALERLRRQIDADNSLEATYQAPASDPSVTPKAEQK